MILYRYEKACYEECLRDLDDKSNVQIRLEYYEVIRNTPKGHVIKVGRKEKWVSSTSKKRYAYQTEEEAMINFIRRTKRSIAIMKHFIDFSELALLKIKEIQTLKPE